MTLTEFHDFIVASWHIHGRTLARMSNMTIRFTGTLFISIIRMKTMKLTEYMIMHPVVLGNTVNRLYSDAYRLLG